jgi:rifampicin phosphotransferase
VAFTAQCLTVLGDRPQLQARFQALVQVAQRYAVLREQQARQLTLGWPLLRRCARRVGQTLHAHGVIDQAEDVFYLTRAELDTRAPLQDVVRQRRTIWERQRRLVAPLTIGRPPRLLANELLGAVDAVHHRPSPKGRHHRPAGQPRPGHRPGPHHPRTWRFRPLPTRRGPGRPGHRTRLDTAVCPRGGGGPDGGTLAAHASLVAREYGIPAVVATGDATTRLTDGQVVTVDGGAGTIHPPQ